MTGTVWCSIAILGLISCLFMGPLIPSAAHAQGVSTAPNRASPAFDIDDLLQYWVHSSEEDQIGEVVRTCRPAAAMQFPPSRFRMAYKFAFGGDCEFYFLSPGDDHHFRACEWSISASNKTTLRIIGDGKTTSFEIVELSGAVLRLRPLE